MPQVLSFSVDASARVLLKSGRRRFRGHVFAAQIPARRLGQRCPVAGFRGFAVHPRSVLRRHPGLGQIFWPAPVRGTAKSPLPKQDAIPAQDWTEEWELVTTA